MLLVKKRHFEHTPRVDRPPPTHCCATSKWTLSFFVTDRANRHTSRRGDTATGRAVRCSERCGIKPYPMIQAWGVDGVSIPF